MLIQFLDFMLAKVRATSVIIAPVLIIVGPLKLCHCFLF